MCVGKYLARFNDLATMNPFLSQALLWLLFSQQATVYREHASLRQVHGSFQQTSASWIEAIVAQPTKTNTEVSWFIVISNHLVTAW